MMRERGLTVDHTTIFRWVQRYASEINKRIHPHLKLAGASHRIDENYVKVGIQWKYLYRAPDKEGQIIEFLLSARRDIAAAQPLRIRCTGEVTYGFLRTKSLPP
jgi:transposase, IS6 family